MKIQISKIMQIVDQMQRQVRLAPMVAKCAGPRLAGPRVAGPRLAGPRVAGPRLAGPRVAGPRAAGPRVAGPRVAGPRAAGPRVALGGLLGPGLHKHHSCVFSGIMQSK